MILRRWLAHGRCATWALMCLVAAACGGDRDANADQPPASATLAPAGDVQSTVTLADSLGWGEAGTLRIEVANRGASPVAGARVRVNASGGLVLGDTAARAGKRASGGDSALLVIAPVAPGQVRVVTLGIRTPPRAAADTTLPPPLIIRSRVISTDGQPLGSERADTLLLQVPVLAAICGGPEARVVRYGIGGVRLGMRVAELRGACPAARDTAWTAEGMPERGVVVPLAGTPVIAVIAGDSVVRVVVDARGVGTPAGVGVGSTLAELRARYGRTCAGAAEGRTAVWFPNAPGISFGLSATAPAEWARSHTDPALLPDTATVARLWVRRGSDDCPTLAAPAPEHP